MPQKNDRSTAGEDSEDEEKSNNLEGTEASDSTTIPDAFGGASETDLESEVPKSVSTKDNSLFDANSLSKKTKKSSRGMKSKSSKSTKSRETGESTHPKISVEHVDAAQSKKSSGKSGNTLTADGGSEASSRGSSRSKSSKRSKEKKSKKSKRGGSREPTYIPKWSEAIDGGRGGSESEAGTDFGGEGNGGGGSVGTADTDQTDLPPPNLGSDNTYDIVPPSEFQNMKNLESKQQQQQSGGRSNFNFDDQMKSTKGCMHSLEQLRSQHEQMLNGLQQSKQLSGEEEGGGGENDSKVRAIEMSKQRIEAGLADAQFMIQCNAYIKQLEGERRLLQAQVRRLCQENSWLREELNTAHQKSQENDQTGKAPSSPYDRPSRTGTVKSSSKRGRSKTSKSKSQGQPSSTNPPPEMTDPGGPESIPEDVDHVDTGQGAATAPNSESGPANEEGPEFDDPSDDEVHMGKHLSAGIDPEVDPDSDGAKDNVDTGQGPGIAKSTVGEGGAPAEELEASQMEDGTVSEDKTESEEDKKRKK